MVCARAPGAHRQPGRRASHSSAQLLTDPQQVLADVSVCRPDVTQTSLVNNPNLGSYRKVNLENQVPA